MKRRILVVDDNPVNLKLAASILEQAGFQVRRAVDAEDALEKIGTERPELILMDLALPGMDGLTLTKKLKADRGTRGILIVALTASAMKGDEAVAIAAGCDGYITKPLDTRQLAKKVSAYLK